jgi:predicted HAD superfamily phosphohydrolase YqeG
METARKNRLQDFEQHTFDFTNAVVILDVDGTLVPDCGRTAADAVVRKVMELKQRGNVIRLCSNSRRSDYAERLAELGTQLDVDVCPVPSRKPSTLALAGVDLGGRALVIIGDKDLTDGLLARRVGARFIKVRRKLDPADRFVSKLANLFDNTVGPIALCLWDLQQALSAPLRKARGGRGQAAYDSSNKAVDR